MKTRIAVAAVLAAACILAGGCEKANTMNEGKLRHVVLFGFNEGTPEAKLGEVEKAFCALPGKIDTIKGFEWGRDCSVEKLQQGYSHCFFVTFDDAAGRKTYLPHPDHKAFGATLRGALKQVLVLDYVCRRSPPTPTARAQDAGKLRHVVLFKFKDGAAPEKIKAVEDAFAALPGKIPQIQAYEWGVDCSVEGKAQGFTHCFLVTFDDAVGREAYLPHPAHKAFVELLKPSLDKVLVIDYVAKTK